MEKRIHTLFDEKLKNLVEEALTDSLFTGCSAAYFLCAPQNGIREFVHFGRTGDFTHNAMVDKACVFDLASLTKPLVVSLLVMFLCDEGKLDIHENVYKFFGSTSGDWASATIADLLNHSSGLPAHRKFYEQLIKENKRLRKSKLIEMILAEKLVSPENVESIYSDLGYMLLGSIIEKITGEQLASFWTRKIANPLGLENDLFFPDKYKATGINYISTGRCVWSDEELLGIVNDDNCRSVGGIAGHAGLFGTARGVVGLVEALCENYNGMANQLPFTIKKYLQGLERSRNRWIFGFDTPSADNSTSGRYFSKKSIGHLGFTGTSFWLDLSRKIGVVLLTNRVRSNGSIASMRVFRSRFHDIIMENFVKTKTP